MVKKNRQASFISRFKGLLIPLVVVVAAITFTTIVRAHGGDTSLIHTCVGTVNGRVTIVGVNDTCGGNETALDWIKNVFAGSGLTIDRGSDGATLSADLTYVQKRVSSSCTAGSAIRAINSDGTVTCEDTNINTGWTAAGETWTYASADDPTFTFTISGDKTGKYSPGMRVKLTQSSEKYFLITKVAYSNPDTTITVYGGIDYDLANASITNPYYSTDKAPQGFPLDPNKWTVEISSTSTVSQANPTPGTWYNLNSLSIDIPIGIWKVQYHIPAYMTGGSGTSTASFTLSTSSNSESDSDFTSILGGPGGSAALGATVTKSKTLSLTSKTTYYVIERVDVATYILTLLSSYSKLFVRAESAYF